ncbi:MAG: hypothetical protein LBB21_00045 [Holosporaceae bacterium]|jgi:hypothetical protein|nr:hypothetical protein [Holosporaceae bacterium]
MKKICALATIFAFCFTSEGMKELVRHKKSNSFDRVIPTFFKDSKSSPSSIFSSISNADIVSSHCIISELSWLHCSIELAENERELLEPFTRVIGLYFLILKLNPLKLADDVLFMGTLNNVVTSMFSARKSIVDCGTLEEEMDNILPHVESLLLHIAPNYFLRPFTALLPSSEFDEPLIVQIPGMPIVANATVKVGVSKKIDYHGTHFRLSTAFADLMFVIFKNNTNDIDQKILTSIGRELKKVACFAFPSICCFDVSFEKANDNFSSIETIYFYERKGSRKAKKSSKAYRGTGKPSKMGQIRFETIFTDECLDEETLLLETSLSECADGEG